MTICILCDKESKKEANCSLVNSNICIQCCFSVSNGDSMMNKMRKEKGLLKEDILARCTDCLQERLKK